MKIDKYIYIIYLHFVLTSCVTFNLDLNNFEDIPDGDWIVLANGNWNMWGWGIELTDQNNDNIFTATNCSFDNGDYEFVYTITGAFDQWSGWGLIGKPPIGTDCDYSPNDNYNNYGFNIYNNDINLDTHQWNCCENQCSDWDGCEAGAFRTHESYLYGRFEVRMKSANGDGLVSSFFTYNTNWDNDDGNLNWNEIDIEMTGNRDNSVQFTTHHPGNPNSWSYGEIINVSFNPHAEFHDYAFEWTPESIKWFIDNQEVYSQVESIVDDLSYSQNIMMNIWPSIWENWTGVWDETDTPKHAYYDYVKYYEYTPYNGNYGTNNNFTLMWSDDFSSFNPTIWSDNSSGTFNGNWCSFNPANTNFYNNHLILSVTDNSNQLNCNEVTGDINIDSVLNVSDIIMIIDVILNGTINSLSTCQILCSDIDFNNLLNVSDIVGIVQIIINE